MPTSGDIAASLKELEMGNDDIPTSILLGAGYDGEKRLAFLEFYEPSSQRIFHYYDKSGHMPYCFTKEPLEELAFLKQRKDVVDVHTEEKMDLINDKRILVSKIVTSDPLAIGGATNERSIRNTITAYEADIKYYENYLYDNQLQVGSFYSVREGKVIPEVMETAAGVEDALHKSLEGSTPPLSDYIRNWALLLTQPQPEIKRAAIDIEVYSPVESRIPDPEKAEYQIISVALAGSDGKKVVYVLERPGLELGPDRVPPDVEKRFFKTEPELLLSMYEDLLTYPVVITFNGDEFDLPYLYQRSLNMNIPKESIPITRGNQMASIRHGIHIDLYRAFNNRSIQIYAFSNKYSEHTLNGVASGLLGREKVEIDVPIGELLLNELAYYNYVDSELTLDLTRFDNDVFMKLFITICRISKMPLEDASRLNVSNWIRSLMIFEHRRWNALVPRREDLEGKGGASSEAIIKGKKYKGGFVVDPKPGVHFNVVVLDFASLYPSLIKVYNLSYETVRCVHPECRDNLIPETDHWVCTKRKGMTSLLIGSLRDVRVGYFKSLSKRPGLTKADKEFFNVISQALKVFLNACFTGDTDIVTPDGIKNIREMKVGDRVVNVNPETMEIDIDRVIEVQEFPYRGEMYHFNDRRFVDLMVTPNHRFLTTNGKGKKPVFRAAEEIFKATDIAIPKIKPRIDTEPPTRLSFLQTAKNIGAMAAFYPGAERPHFWFAKLPEDFKLKLRKNKVPDEKGSKLVGGARPFFRVPARELTENDIDRAEAIGGSVFFSQPKCFKVPARLETEDFAALCGWFVSEGSLFSNTPKLYADGGHRGSSQGITVSQSYGRGNPNGDSYRNEIGRLLDRLGLKHDADPGGKRYFRIASSVLHEWMLSNCYMAGTLHHTSISKRVPRFVFESERNMKAFLDAAYMGDGSAKQCCYTTNSRRLAEDMVVLTSLLGAKSKIKRDGNVYRVVFKNVSSKLTYAGAETRKYVRKVPFDGTVYCVTTEKNHTVIAGRNGRFVHVGQSYGVMGYDNFALYCLPVAEATAALGRYSIGKTIDKAKELGVEVLYGDSVAGDSVVWVKEPAGVHATRIENLFGWPLGTTIDGKEYFMPRELSVLTLDDAGRAVFKPVKHVMRHLTKKRLYRLSLTNRLALTVTEDHSLISLPPRRGKESHAKSLKFVEIKPTEVGRRVKELIALTRVPLEKVAVRGYPREVYEFLGSFVGSGRFQWTEGRVGSKLDGYVIPAGSDAKALLSLVAKLKEGGWVEDYALQGSPGEIAIRGGKLTILLMELAEAFGQTKVPFFIFNESEENVASFLRGIFGLEGSLLLVKGGRVARLSSPRACIPDGIRELLWRLGMPSSTYYTVIVKKDGTSGSPLFWLEMEDAQALFEKVGFLDSKAKRRLQKASLRGARAEREGDFVRVGVMDVTEVKGDSYVYDLEVEGSHRFFANGILCHNTDSVFLRAPSPEQLDLILAWARKELGIDLEVDKVYRYAAFSSRKKNYAAVYPDGSLEVKGLTGKKSNVPQFIKRTFKDVLKVLSDVKNPDEFTAARENIRQMLRDTYLRLKRREIPMEDLAFHVMMSKAVDRYTENTPQHVKAAQLLLGRGREMKPGDVISFVKTTNGVGVKPVELAKPEDIDVDKYVEYMRGTFDQLLDSLGYDFDEILGATKLEDFFGF